MRWVRYVGSFGGRRRGCQRICCKLHAGKGRKSSRCSEAEIVQVATIGESRIKRGSKAIEMHTRCTVAKGLALQKHVQKPTKCI